MVYRIKRLQPGKAYACRHCGGGLRLLTAVTLVCPACGTSTQAEAVDPAALPTCTQCADAPVLTWPSAAPRDGVNIPSSAGRSRGSADSDLARLPQLVAALTARLDALAAPATDAPAAVATSAELQEVAAGLRAELAQFLADQAKDLQAIDDKVSRLVEGNRTEEAAGVAEGVVATRELVLERLDAWRDAHQADLSALAEAITARPAGTTVEVDIDELADRLVAGIRGRTPLLDSESSSAVDALARVADQLVKEQNANSSRLDALAAALRAAMAGIANLEEWRAQLPLQVAEDIGRMVDDRVVGPVSAALSRQAPAILSDLQDSKLVDIVSRSVREAQRPLLREILSGGRQG
ncbi:MAG: hypothetical protein LIP77_09985, partial [Planctomycetes bacterium]|nr:hypothetical protein [Planctomycetota bacterium]